MTQVMQAASFMLKGGRSHQQDSRWPDTDTPPAGVQTFIVCDGVGGSDSGEKASALVRDVMVRELSVLKSDVSFTHAHLRRAMTQAYFALEQAGRDLGTRNMATTLALLHLHKDGISAAHIGDSRIYLFRPGCGIIYRSNDHSLVNSLVHRGLLSPQEATDHPDSNVITRSFNASGKSDERAALTVRDFSRPEHGDIFLLCSDGVTESISDEELQNIILSSGSLVEKNRKIAELCVNASDNATAILVEVDGAQPLDSISVDEDRAETRIIKTREGETTELQPLQEHRSFFDRVRSWFK